METFVNHIDGLVQERCNSSALAMELHLLCTNPSISSQMGNMDEILQKQDDSILSVLRTDMKIISPDL